MDKLKTILLEQLAKQGVSFLLMVCGLIYLYIQIESLEVEFKSCNQENKELLKNYSSEMKSIIIRNTEAFERIQEKIK